MDGTADGDLKTEQKRQKEESWAVYTEANPRGAGNTMNRGLSACLQVDMYHPRDIALHIANLTLSHSSLFCYISPA